MKALKSFLKVMDYQTAVVICLAIISTYLCRRFQLEADMPSGLIGVAVIFPIVFSINAAYRRREEALKYFASLKAHALALFYAHRDWTPQDSRELAHGARMLIEELFQAVRDYFTAGPGEERSRFYRVHEVFSQLSRSHESLRRAGVPANEISRANQYLRSLMIDFGRMRNIYNYRTPRPLRAYSQVFLNSFPVLFGPYFAYLSQKFYPVIGYMVAVIYSLVLVSLDNIQEDLENPYDQVGEDDIRLDVTAEYQEILAD